MGPFWVARASATTMNIHENGTKILYWSTKQQWRHHGRLGIARLRSQKTLYATRDTIEKPTNPLHSPFKITSSSVQLPTSIHYQSTTMYCMPPSDVVLTRLSTMLASPRTCDRWSVGTGTHRQMTKSSHQSTVPEPLITFRLRNVIIVNKRASKDELPGETSCSVASEMTLSYVPINVAIMPPRRS